MKDPTRIPAIIGQLQSAWEGHADLTFAQFWGVLEAHGIGWGASDDELRHVLETLIRAHPPRLVPGQLGDNIAVVDTFAPRRRITVDGRNNRVTVRDFAGKIRPASWVGATIRTIATHAPAVITDAAGIDHQLGVVERIRVAPYPAAVGLTGRRRRDMGDDIYGAVLSADGATSLAVIGHRVEVHHRRQRLVDTESHSLDVLVSCEVGHRLQIRVPGRKDKLVFGEVTELFPLEL